MNIRELKQNAKQELSQNRGSAVLAIIMPVLVYFVLYGAFFGIAFAGIAMEQLILSFIGFAAVFVIVIAFIPVTVGYAHFFRPFVAGDKPPVKAVAKAWTGGNFWRNLGRILQTILYFYLWYFLIALLAGIVMSILTFIGMQAGFVTGDDFLEMMLSLLAVNVVIGVVALIFVLFKALSYAMVPFVLSDEEFDQHYFAPVELSRLMMKGNKRKLLLTLLSFIGWMILGVLTLHILTILHVGPYIWGTLAGFYEEAKKNLPEEHK